MSNTKQVMDEGFHIARAKWQLQRNNGAPMVKALKLQRTCE
jgi:hypothetical protein